MNPIDYSNILYYQISFSEEQYRLILELLVRETKCKIITCNDMEFPKKAKKDDMVVSLNNIMYKLNDMFHITVLYSGGKVDERCDTLHQLLDKSFKISINTIGIDESFICMGISIPDDLPYYGNNVKHITIALNNYEKGKKVFPKDSYTALLCNNTINVSDFTLDGKFSVNLKKN